MRAVFCSSLSSCFPGTLLEVLSEWFWDSFSCSYYCQYHICFHIQHAPYFKCKVLTSCNFLNVFITFLSPKTATLLLLLLFVTNLCRVYNYIPETMFPGYIVLQLFLVTIYGAYNVISHAELFFTFTLVLSLATDYFFLAIITCCGQYGGILNKLIHTPCCDDKETTTT
jgi:hypothetical protein